MIVSKKKIYILLLFVITLLGIIIVPTYAKFGSGYTTEEDVVGLSLGFNIGITDVNEYQEIVVPAGGTEKFNIEVTNSTGDTVYYGIWYKMIIPETLSSDISIGKLDNSTISTSGSIDNNGIVTVPIGIVNNSTNQVIIAIGVASSTTSTSDIEYINGKYLITGEAEFPRDIMITSIKIDGEESDSLPTGGYYTMTATCAKGSTLTWNPLNKNITYAKGAKIGDSCSLVFTENFNYPLLSSMPVGSYVAYEGTGGTVGSTSVTCKKNGSASSSTASAETEAPNSCLGQNAREDLDENGNTFGYCNNATYKYYTTGWRLAYVDSNNKSVIVSAGSPECNTRASSTANVIYIQTANALALKYCNTVYVDGDCSCTSTTDGQCDSASTDAWAINDTDFYYMTKAISGVGKRLTSGSSSLGDSGGTLGTTLYCRSKYSYQECGYNNDLIDNGGYYWFAAQYTSSNTDGVYWLPYNRYVSFSSSAIAYAFGLRPVISLSSSVYVTGGSGTMDDPYTIEKIIG